MKNAFEKKKIQVSGWVVLEPACHLNNDKRILKSHKAEPIEAKINDSFDYSFHEALSSLEKEDVPNNTILEIIQDGWKLDKDVIRYTKVITSREPKPPEPEPELEKEEKTEEEKPLEEAKPEESKEASSIIEPNNKEKKDVSDPSYIS